MTAIDAGRPGKPRRPPRALELLRKVLATGSVDSDRLVQAFVVSRETFESYLSEDVLIPLDRQLCLALFVIEHLPGLSREGHRLRGQVAAAIAFEQHDTQTHLQAPPSLGF